MRIICLGDDLISDGKSEDSCDWLTILKEKAVHTYVGKMVCGDTTNGMLARFYRDVVKNQAESVIFTGGMYDYIAGWHSS